MAWNKYLGAFRDRKQILEGIRNRIFQKEHVEAEAARRWSICKYCNSLDQKGSKCMAPGTQPCCGECGCSLSFKTRALSSSCPLEKWLAVMDEITEEQLLKNIK